MPEPRCPLQSQHSIEMTGMQGSREGTMVAGGLHMKYKEFKTAQIGCGPQKGPSVGRGEGLAGPNRSQEPPGDKDREGPGDQPTSLGTEPCAGGQRSHAFW